MATLVPYKRPVVLSLAELERYPTTNDRYAITVPFNTAEDPFENPLKCSCPGDSWSKRGCPGCDLCSSFAKLKAKAIKQTEKRWAWFSEARKEDDRLGRRLGTLGFLPPEIRYKIWFAVIENLKDAFKKTYIKETDAVSWDVLWENWLKGNLTFKASHGNFSRLDIFNLRSYHQYKREWNPDGAMYLRYASPEAKIELENTFIFKNAFAFDCAKYLTHFLNQLSAYQRSLLRCITIRPFGCSNCHWDNELGALRYFIRPECRAWTAIIEQLPATLKSVTIELGWTCTIKLAAKRHPEYRASVAIDNVKTLVGMLELVTKKIQRQAPGVKISLARLDNRCDRDRKSLQAMLDELSPFSEDFMRWSDESRKDAMDEGQGC